MDRSISIPNPKKDPTIKFPSMILSFKETVKFNRMLSHHNLQSLRQKLNNLN